MVNINKIHMTDFKPKQNNNKYIVSLNLFSHYFNLTIIQFFILYRIPLLIN